MLSGLMGRKLGMTHIFTKDGEMIPVTVLEVGPGYVIQKKNIESEGYESVQMGFYLAQSGRKKRNNLPTKGKLKKAGLADVVLTDFKEFKILDKSEIQLGQKITCEIFQEGEHVDVTGTSKGRGFAGVMKRYNWSGQPKTHGSMMHRRTGSIGASATPSRVLKGKKLPGHMGASKSTIQNLIIRKIELDKNIILVEGAVPGFNSSKIIIKRTVKRNKLDKK